MVGMVEARDEKSTRKTNALDELFEVIPFFLGQPLRSRLPGAARLMLDDILDDVWNDTGDNNVRR